MTQTQSTASSQAHTPSINTKENPLAVLTTSTFVDKSRHTRLLRWAIAMESESADPKDTDSQTTALQLNSEFLQDSEPVVLLPWRMTQRMKTVSVALVLCLNIGTDPPDVVKTSPCARKECWIDPFSMPSQKALEAIGKTLQSQYERWQPRARYRQLLDPTVEDTKKLALSLRRNAKQDRVLWHYNGHGVPRPTPNGEIWVFNKNYTQYIPLSVYDLQAWIGQTAIYVLDCSAAGVLLPHFCKSPQSSTGSAGNDMNAEANTANGGTPSAIVLAACGATELLPMNPEFSADVFTSCLTTPITVALRWFISFNSLTMSHIDPSFIDRIPGKLTDRKTPLGELNWIFTAITDTIAWNLLPRNLFQRLFRQDLLVASLFRNFLLAERILTSAGCTPCSVPALPPTYHHSLWQSWDLAAEMCLAQLARTINPSPLDDLVFQPSPFFADQLTAFEVWLEFGTDQRDPPEQLPIVLQVLLSQIHRLRALRLLRLFLDLGPWAVNLALTVGIFPYVLKLLQSPAMELRQVLVFIWAKILALDKSCQVDLVKDNGHIYFLKHLSGATRNPPSKQQRSKANVSDVALEQKVMTAFILCVICEDYRPGKLACLQHHLHAICCNLLKELSSVEGTGATSVWLRQWLCFCLANLYDDLDEAKVVAIQENVPSILLGLLRDQSPEVRAAAAYALGRLIGMSSDSHRYHSYIRKQSNTYQQVPKYGNGDMQSPPEGLNESKEVGDVPHYSVIEERAHIDVTLGIQLLLCSMDASVLVRREILYAIARLVLHPHHQQVFVAVAQTISKHRSTDTAVGSPQTSPPLDEKTLQTIGSDALEYCQIWEILKSIQNRDVFPAVAQLAARIVGCINTLILPSERILSEKQQITSSIQEGLAAVTLCRESSLPNLSNTTEAQNSAAAANCPFSERDLNNTRKLQMNSTLRPSQSFGNIQGLHSSVENSAPRISRTPAGLGTRENSQARQNGEGSNTAKTVVLPFPDNLESKLYKEAKVLFNQPMAEYFQDPNSQGNEDPLSDVGAARKCRYRRNMCAQQQAEQLRQKFEAKPDNPPTISGISASYGSDSSRGSLSSGGLLSSSIKGSFSTSRDVTSAEAGYTPTMHQSVVLDNEAEMTSQLLFHPYEDSLVVVDERDGISLWNYEDGEKALQFSNKNPRGTRVTSCDWVNVEDEALLLCGSEDGGVKIWRGLHDLAECTYQKTKPQLATSFVAVPDLSSGTHGSGVVTSWQPQNGRLVVGGNSTNLRIWNMDQEQCIATIPTGTEACMTSITSDRTKFLGDIVVAGSGDGSVRLFDPRIRPEHSLASCFREHDTWIVHVHLKPQTFELFSGSLAGDVKFWDLRNSKASLRTLEVHRSPMTALCAHDYAPVFASGTHNQFINVFNRNGAKITTIRYHDGFLGERIGPVSCLSFHPYQLVLAAGATDSLIAIYSSDR